MIDKFFRRALEHAEATPPADLFDRVMEARAERHRRRALIWWRRPALLALVLASGAAASLLWFRPEGTEDLTAGVPATSSNSIEPTTNSLPETDQPPAPTTLGVATTARHPRALRTAPGVDEGPKRNSTSVAVPGPMTGSVIRSSSSAPHFAPPASPGSTTTPTAGATQSTGPVREAHALLAIRGVPEGNMGAAAPRTIPPGTPYVLPKADWWIGVRATALNEQVIWRGDQERLVNALNAAEPATTNWALGLLGGRTWRSGLQIGAGLLYEWSERAFSAIDQQVTVDQDVNTYYVTLNSEVFVSQVDTITTVTTMEQAVATSQEHSLLRIPVEVGWVFDVWRFQLVPKAGLALDLHLQRDGTVLNVEGADGRLVAAQPSDAVLRQRQPNVLLVTTGVDIGIALNEHWSMNLGPQMMWTAAALTRSTDQPQGLPQRAGIGFGLTYLLPGKRP